MSKQTPAGQTPKNGPGPRLSTPDNPAWQNLYFGSGLPSGDLRADYRNRQRWSTLSDAELVALLREQPQIELLALQARLRELGVGGRQIQVLRDRLGRLCELGLAQCIWVKKTAHKVLAWCASEDAAEKLAELEKCAPAAPRRVDVMAGALLEPVRWPAPRAGALAFKDVGSRGLAC